MIWVTAAAIVVGVASIYLLWTAPNWLSWMLGGLDRFLVRMGAGTWAAGFITWAENRAAERRARRGNRKVRGNVEAVTRQDHPGASD